MLKELIEAKQGELQVPGMRKDDMDHIMNYICTNQDQLDIFFPSDAGFHPASSSCAGERFFQAQNITSIMYS